VRLVCAGLALLFDEFEDVIQNLNRRDFQEEAFLNLFRFFEGERYSGMSYFAVTPDFVSKSILELARRGSYDFDYDRFIHLSSFAMDELIASQFATLGRRIRRVHARAYDWSAKAGLSDAELSNGPDTVDRELAGSCPECHSDHRAHFR
jgi:hypothetical protein